MAYRNGTYVAFHADGNNLPGGKSDIDHYRLMQAWNSHPDDEFTMVNSYEKATAVRDDNLKATLRLSLLARLRSSRNMLLIVGKTTSSDTDWVQFEVEHAVDAFKIPIVAAYTMRDTAIMDPYAVAEWWPPALRFRIDNGTAKVIHIPFKKGPIMDALANFSHKAPPKGGGLGIYTAEAYKHWGIPL